MWLIAEALKEKDTNQGYSNSLSSPREGGISLFTHLDAHSAGVIAEARTAPGSPYGCEIDAPTGSHWGWISLFRTAGRMRTLPLLVSKHPDTPSPCIDMKTGQQECRISVQPFIHVYFKESKHCEDRVKPF